MEWNCSQCREAIDEGLDVCWSCGTGRDGTVDPDFQHADAYEPQIPGEKPQFALAGLFKLMTALCLVFALSGSLVAGLPSVLTVFPGLAAIAYLSLHVVVWLLTRRVHRWQRRVQAEQGKPNRH